MTDFVVPASLKNVHEACDVGVHIGMRVNERIPDPCLSGKMTDQVKLLFLKKLPNRLPVFEVRSLEPVHRIFRALDTLARFSLSAIQAVSSKPPVLELNIVVIIDVVDADNLIASFGESHRHKRPDKPRRSCNQDFHGKILSKQMASFRSVCMGLPNESSATSSTSERTGTFSEVTGGRAPSFHDLAVGEAPAPSEREGNGGGGKFPSQISRGKDPALGRERLGTQEKVPVLSGVYGSDANTFERF